MEEAEERSPPERVERPEETVSAFCAVKSPPNVPVEEAVNVPAVFKEPEVKREEEKVEEAEESRPPVRVERPVTPKVEERVAAPAIWMVEEEVIGPEELREPPT